MHQIGLAFVAERTYPVWMKSEAGIDPAFLYQLGDIIMAKREAYDDLILKVAAPLPADEERLEMLRENMDQVLKTLTYREREIIKLRYGLCDGQAHTQEMVGRVFRLTGRRIGQIEAKAIRKLQH